MQYSNYTDTDSRDSGRLQPVDASTPAQPVASYSGAYRPATPPPLDLSSAQPVAPTPGAYQPAVRPQPVQPQPPQPVAAPQPMVAAAPQPVAAAIPAEPSEPNVILATFRHWFRGKHVVAGAAIAVVLAGFGFFALRSSHHQTTADAAAKAPEVADPATTRTIDDNFSRLDADLTSVDAAMAEQPGDIAE